MIKIEFFNKGKSLGAFPLKDFSNHKDREEVADVNGLGEFDKFVLDDGRVTGNLIGHLGNTYQDKQSNTWGYYSE